jgi:hypothetical protein
MHTLVLFPAYLLSAPATDAPPGGQHVLAVLGAAGVLLFAFVSMRRAVIPFAEILKSALYAVSTFLLVALAVVLLLVSLIR